MSKLIPRLSMAELNPQLAEMLRPKVERLNYLGEFFQCTAHQPQALMSFYQLTEDLKHALAVIERQGHDTTSELEAVIKAIGHEQAIAVLMLIGRYMMHALIVNSLALEPPVTSPLEEK